MFLILHVQMRMGGWRTCTRGVCMKVLVCVLSMCLCRCVHIPSRSLLCGHWREMISLAMVPPKMSFSSGSCICVNGCACVRACIYMPSRSLLCGHWREIISLAIVPPKMSFSSGSCVVPFSCFSSRSNNIWKNSSTAAKQKNNNTNILIYIIKY